MNTEEKIRKQIADNRVILYMKGTPENPQCGFSLAAVQALKQTGIEYAYVNVLQAPFIRERLPRVSQWPTYPQLFVEGQLVGGSDIICDMVEQGSLQKLAGVS